jgi:small subunit ribosomal protein S8
MSMTDPIADLLTRIRNGHMAGHVSVSVPGSKMKAEIVRIMKDEGYIADFVVEDTVPQDVIRVDLKYTGDGGDAITGIERVSSPGRRVYCTKGEIPKVLNGLGINIVSTSRGVMTGSACRRQGVGGEILCNIW